MTTPDTAVKGAAPVPGLAGNLAGLAMAEPLSGRAVVGWVVLVLTVVLSVTTILVLLLREETLDRAEANIARVNLSLAQTLERQFQSVDIVLTEIAAEINEAASPNFIYSPGLHTVLKRLSAGLAPAVQRIGIFDAAGRVANTSADGTLPTSIVTDRLYFTGHRDRPDAGLIVSEPVQNRVSGGWTFIISRRITGQHGVFLGVVVAGIEFSYLEKLFAAIVPEEDARVALLRQDLMMLFRHPDWPGIHGRMMADSPTYQGIFADGRTAGSGRYMGTTDLKERVAAARRLDHYPFVVSIAIPEDSVLEPWRRLSLGISVAALAVVVTLSALLVTLWRQRGQRSLSETALAETRSALVGESGRLWAVVETASDGFWEWHLDSGLVDWSERCCALMGLPAAGAVLHSQQMLDMIALEDRGRYQSALRRLIETGEPLNVEARWRTADGGWCWLASRARIINGPEGKPQRMIGANSDISMRKLLETELPDPADDTQ